MKNEHDQKNSNDPLRELLVEIVEVDRIHLVTVLKDYLRLNSKDGKILLQENFNHLCIKNKVLAYLLGRKVSFMLEFEHSDAVCKEEIKFATEIMRGMLTPLLIELKTEELISRAKSEGYFVSDKQMLHAVKELEKASRKRNYLKKQKSHNAPVSFYKK